MLNSPKLIFDIETVGQDFELLDETSKEYFLKFAETEEKIQEAVSETINLVRLVNAYVEKQAPWKAAKTDLARAGTILYTATEALRISAILLSPVMPAKCETVLDVLSAKDSSPQWGQLKVGTKLKSHEALFPRLETAKK